jgi:hypothetical protein
MLYFETVMLTIRNDQFGVFSGDLQSQFVNRLLPHLAADYPSWYQERQDPGAREFVERVIENGMKHKIRSQSAVSTLVDLMIEFGEKFEKSPDRQWAMNLLAHPSLPDGIKTSLLAERLRVRTGGRRIVEIEAS